VDLIEQIESASWSECRASRIVLVDGCLCESLSAVPSSCALFQQDDATIFYIPPSIQISAPVQIISIHSQSALTIVRLQILLGQNAHLDLVQSIKEEGMAADRIDAFLDEGAVLRLADQIQLANEAHLLRFLHASLQRNARLSSFSCSQGARMLKRDWQVVLNGEGAEVELKGLDDLSGNRQAHTRTCVQHRAPLCRSRQHFKKALQDQSRASSEGTIRIESTAHCADANQLCQNLLLSDEASAIVKPCLDIFADDVSATHGATFSQPSDDELFYCQSRGISKPEAKELWRRGFCREMINAIEIPLMRDKLL
jgi:Fe-S cluster assembly protein SufD